MKIVFSRRAVADLDHIASYYAGGADPIVARAVALRLHQTIDHIGRAPDAAQKVAGRPQVRVISVVRYPYRIFYRPVGDEVRILHIRHTSRNS